MEAVRTSETSVNFNVTTWRYIPEDSKLHTHRRFNLKSHMTRISSLELDGDGRFGEAPTRNLLKRLI
jgi:hypothetical protein